MVRTLYARKVSTVSIFSIVIRLLSRCIYFQQTKIYKFPLLLWVFMLIKGYVVPLRAQGLGSRTSKCAIKSLDNSSFKIDLYISGRS